MNTNYDKILGNMNAENIAKCIEKGMSYQINKTVNVDGINIEWLVMIADANRAYILCSIKQLGSNLFNYATLSMQLWNTQRNWFGGCGGYYLDAETDTLYLLNYLRVDLTFLKKDVLRICVNRIHGSLYTRRLSPLTVNLLNVPFDMPTELGVSLSVHEVDFEKDCIMYTFILSTYEVRRDGYCQSQGFVFPQSSNRPILYISTLDKENDEENKKRCSRLSLEQNGDSYTFRCKFMTDGLTKEDIDNLYFVFSKAEPVEIEGDFGTTFEFQPKDINKQFYNMDVNKQVTIKDTNLTIKNVIIGHICIRVIIEGSLENLDWDVRKIIKMTNAIKN